MQQRLLVPSPAPMPVLCGPQQLHDLLGMDAHSKFQKYNLYSLSHAVQSHPPHHRDLSQLVDGIPPLTSTDW